MECRNALRRWATPGRGAFGLIWVMDRLADSVTISGETASDVGYHTVSELLAEAVVSGHDSIIAIHNDGYADPLQIVVKGVDDPDQLAPRMQFRWEYDA